ncbi:MAG: hypothetical protein J6Z27_00590, partial [Bacteroidales bacterium]|nr:hypothetical protein [Bacteroidales bacterium]
PTAAQAETAAPAPAPAPEEPKPAPKIVDTGFSIKNLISEIEQDANSGAKAEDRDEERSLEPVDSEKIEKAWKEVVDSIKQPRLQAELSRFVPVYNEQENTATQYVSNANQKSWIMSNCFFALESALRKSLRNRDTKLIIEVLPDTAPKEVKPYTSSEIAQAMREKSKDMKTLEQTFELELM